MKRPYLPKPRLKGIFIWVAALSMPVIYELANLTHDDQAPEQSQQPINPADSQADRDVTILVNETIGAFRDTNIHACSSATPCATPTPVPTPVPTPKPTPTPTPVHTPTPTPTPVRTPTPTPVHTPTPAPGTTPKPTPTPAVSVAPSHTPVPTPGTGGSGGSTVTHDSTPTPAANSTAANETPSDGTIHTPEPLDPSDSSAPIGIGTVVIHVTDQNGAGAEGAQVTLAGQTRRSDQDGNASFTNIPAGLQPVRISYDGATQVYDLTVSDSADGQKFTLAAARKPAGPPWPLIIFGSLVGLGVLVSFLLRRALWRLAGTGHARPIKISVALTLTAFFIGLIGLLVAGLLF